MTRSWSSCASDFHLLPSTSANFSSPLFDVWEFSVLPTHTQKLCHILALQLRANYIISVAFDFLICKMGEIVVPHLQSYWEYWMMRYMERCFPKHAWYPWRAVMISIINPNPHFPLTQMALFTSSIGEIVRKTLSWPKRMIMIRWLMYLLMHFNKSMQNCYAQPIKILLNALHRSIHLRMVSRKTEFGEVS